MSYHNLPVSVISFGCALVHYVSLKLTRPQLWGAFLPSVDFCSSSLEEIPLATIAALPMQPVPASLGPCLLPTTLVTCPVCGRERQCPSEAELTLQSSAVESGTLAATPLCLASSTPPPSLFCYPPPYLLPGSIF